MGLITIISIALNIFLIITLVIYFIKNETIVFKGFRIGKDSWIEFERDKEAAFAKLYKQNKRLRKRLALLTTRINTLDKKIDKLYLIFVIIAITTATNKYINNVSNRMKFIRKPSESKDSFIE